MQVILKKDVDKLGKTMDVVSVRDGYARNFLMPQGCAVAATAGNRKAIEAAKMLSEKREEKKLKEARQLAKKIEKVPCTLPVQVHEEDKIYGSITGQEIAEFLIKEGYEIDKNSIELEEPIKQLGVYSVTIRIYKDAIAKLKVWVVKDENK